MRFWTNVVAATGSCSFPFTYNGELYYECMNNMSDVSTQDQPLACISVNATPVVCDRPGR